MLDAQVVDIGIVGGALLREILTEVTAVGADGLAEIVDADIVAQIELRGLAVLR